MAYGKRGRHPRGQAGRLSATMLVDPSAPALALLLARVQFGFTIAFHIVFPALSIGLASFLALVRLLELWRREAVWRRLFDFWLPVFAVAFAMGVVSGIVMAFQFGMHWSRFAAFAGSVTGPLFAYEVLSAFFLEAGFLGVMLFGRERVGPGLHALAAVMVALGTLISATWILAANSWMQTPAGFVVEHGRAVPLDWVAIVFNPSFPYRLVHMVLAAYLSTALFVGACGAWQILRGRDLPQHRGGLSMAMGMLLVAAPLQLLAGDLHGLATLRQQPAKIAAIEGHWENTPGPRGAGMPLTLVGFPDMQAETTRHALRIPRLGSLILTHSWDGTVPGLKQFAPADRPNAAIVFWTFRVMVALGLLMIALALWAQWLRRDGRLWRDRRFLRCAVALGPGGLIALLAGWMTAEIGRQPWVIYGVMRTADAVSAHTPATLTATLATYLATYLAVFGMGGAYLLRLATRALPPSPGSGLEADPAPRPARPMSAAGPVADDAGGDR